MTAIEHVAANLSEVMPGQMKAVELGRHTVLLVNIDGNLHAIGGTCPHYGAPLVEGTLCGKRLICPWHQSNFDITTGNFLEPPVMDNLPHYALRTQGDKILVTVPGATDRVEPPMVRADYNSNGMRYCIVGAGAAGNMAAQTLREAGFQGYITLISHETRPPYDRPNLSKEYLQGALKAEALTLRDEEFFHRHGIERLAYEVTRVDVKKKLIQFKEKVKPLEFDTVLLATGSVPKRLDVPGADLPNVFTLRSFDDAQAIIGALHGSRAVVVGSSFIGMEVAASLVKRGLEVTVVGRTEEPFEKQLGKQLGRRFRVMHESHGITFYNKSRVQRFEGDERARRVVLDSGHEISADVFIVGVGVTPQGRIVHGIDHGEDGSITVDRYLRAAPEVFAAGDIARFPDSRSGRFTRIEHWRTAEQMGRMAALNMHGQALEFNAVPFFWTFQFELGLDYIGHADAWDEVILDGDLEKLDFMAYYVQDNRVLAAAGANRTAQAAAFAELMRLNALPPGDEFRAGSIDLIPRMRAATRALA